MTQQRNFDIDMEMPTVSVGILNAPRIVFTLYGDYSVNEHNITGNHEVMLSDGKLLWREQRFDTIIFKPLSPTSSFAIDNVKIGINFHWERSETQRFSGLLKLVVDNNSIIAINELPIENYLESVISSEMNAEASIELLKSHAVISRSWLLCQQQRLKHNKQCLQTRHHNNQAMIDATAKSMETYDMHQGQVKWYDREDHQLFDVCADDHCQRYQGITRVTNPNVKKAVEETRGEVLMSGEEICDARFSKCCGGQTEEYQYCWENTPKDYLKSVADDYCNTDDHEVLRQVLNDYDLETSDFHDWKAEYSVAELSELVSRKLGKGIGLISDIVPLERGRSGRISLIQIVTDRGKWLIGKELEIRRIFSENHLKSSWFEIEKEKDGDNRLLSITFKGKGWGHGVGLCQIGAAVMGSKGISYRDILSHYYTGAEIRKLW